MIPDEAVEAAARAIYPHTRSTFDETYEHIRERCRVQARAALEASAPHLMASAWDEGLEVGLVSAVRIDSAPDVNPYQKAPDA